MNGWLVENLWSKKTLGYIRFNPTCLVHILNVLNAASKNKSYHYNLTFHSFSSENLFESKKKFLRILIPRLCNKLKGMQKNKCNSMFS